METTARLHGGIRGRGRGIRNVIASDLESLDRRARELRRRRAMVRRIADPKRRRLAEIELHEEEDRIANKRAALSRVRDLHRLD